ncbi:hypothetical protein EVAR_61140_1 [Eumeta japonica]|uniref:RNase H type-1 domain-containing protein n=1 Tax=Eumeta variegata TaxID=151549 RepID=A0A4C2AE12_EUMVA|nr:hypothetical protein EVAR_61140_1 [Eumeta japonica]
MVSLDIEGAFDNAVAGVGDPAARPWLPGEPPWPGPRLPSGPGVGFVDRGGGQPRLARVHCWGVRNKLSPSGQGDVGSESGDREDHIHYRDRAYRSVRFVRLGTGDEEARAKDARRCPAQRRSEGMPGSPYSVPAFRAHPREAAPQTLEREVAWLYESVEDLDPQTVDRLAVVGPRIFTDGSRIEGKVGAALTEWRDGRETWYSTLRLDPFCTVFQAEMVALQRAIRRVKNGKDGLVNIFSDSRSSLEVLAGPKTYHPLAHEARRDISEIVAEGRAVRLFWVRAHAGIAGNERADELARRAALTKKTAADYDRFPLSYAKR